MENKVYTLKDAMMMMLNTTTHSNIVKEEFGEIAIRPTRYENNMIKEIYNEDPRVIIYTILKTFKYLYEYTDISISKHPLTKRKVYVRKAARKFMMDTLYTYNAYVDANMRDLVRDTDDPGRVFTINLSSL